MIIGAEGACLVLVPIESRVQQVRVSHTFEPGVSRLCLSSVLVALRWIACRFLRPGPPGLPSQATLAQPSQAALAQLPVDLSDLAA